MAAVLSGDPIAMAADYAADAVLVRDVVYEGRASILAYFESVPSRLDGAELIFGDLSVSGATAVVPWSISGRASGRDTLTIEGGEIVRQVVQLDGGDF